MQPLSTTEPVPRVAADPKRRDPAAPRAFRLSARSKATLTLVLVLLLLTFLPPLLSLSRYQRRVARSMAEVLGRPVHFDRITLNLLPLPSFTIQNLVIDEAPEFGAEPIIRANTVNARLRVSSLWRHRLEFSRITFAEPSVNLVQSAGGRWNLEGILEQASRADAAPTAQESAGDAPRFPYIEASNARINLKLGQEKTPFSLTEADFALWLPQPQQWRTRLRAKPVRTDTNVTDTGTLRIEATLDRAPALGQTPLVIDATWSDAPLGGLSRIFTAGDVGLRGQMNLSAQLRGVLAAAKLHLRLQLDDVHRADFVPEHALAADIDCTAKAARAFRTLEDVRCLWPVPDTKDDTVAMTGTVPDVLDPRSAQAQIGTPHLAAPVLLTWLRVLSDRIPPSTRLTGSVAASASHQVGSLLQWTGRLRAEDLTLAGGRLGAEPLAIESASLESADPANPQAAVAQLAPVTLPLGGRDPALLDGRLKPTGYTLHLSGSIVIARLLALGATVPQFGDGLAEVLPRNRGAGPTRLDLTAHRTWGGPQVWTDTLTHPAAPSTPPGRRRRRRR